MTAPRPIATDRQPRVISRSLRSRTHDCDCSQEPVIQPMLATVKAGVVSAEVEQLRFWVRGTKGSFKKFHLDPQEDQLKGAKAGASLPETFGVEGEGRAASVTTVGEGGELERKTWETVSPPPTYVEYYRIFGKAVAGEGEVPVRAEEARDVLRIVEAALLSSKEGRSVSL